jgi:c-di-AMP phosphodiesterase-like protein
VAMQTYGEDVKYFGGSTEAAEKRSRVRVRVMSHALRDLIMRSSNVIICGHKMADFDCIGSAICLARMAESLHKPAVVIAKTGGIEEKLSAALKENADAISAEVDFVTESEAMNHLSDNTLVIMTDHHNSKQSNGSKVLENAKRIVIIDHHRRSTEMGVKPVLVYIEAGASSTCELLTEMIPYVSSTMELTPLNATLMLTGMIVDTQTWRVRTGARTYDAASELKELGADSNKAYGWLKDSFEDFALKAQVAVNSERYPNGIVIAIVKDRQLTRSMMSQVADSLLSVQGVQGAFVIANDDDNESAISARSDGHINVQVIMENMNGGGHMTAAALQRPKCNLDDLKAELLGAIDDYNKEDEADESDS